VGPARSAAECGSPPTPPRAEIGVVAGRAEIATATLGRPRLLGLDEGRGSVFALMHGYGTRGPVLLHAGPVRGWVFSWAQRRVSSSI
jgi:hypothetical protein